MTEHLYKKIKKNFASSLENFKKNIFDLKKQSQQMKKSGQIEKRPFELPDNWYQITQETLELNKGFLISLNLMMVIIRVFINGDIRILTVDDLARNFFRE